MITLFKNGNIHTMDTFCPNVDTIVVKANKFVYVGTESDAYKYVNKNGGADKEVDLEGSFVLPGFNDSHMHLMHYAKSIQSVKLVGTHSIEEIKERMKEGLKHRKPNCITWLEGEGWNHDYFDDEKRFPNKFDLDEVSNEVPIMILRACYHIAVLNTAAMKVIGLDKKTAHKYGDLVGLLPNGEPDGIVRENMLDYIWEQNASLNVDTIKDIIIEVQDKVLEQGLTSIQSDDIGSMPNCDYNLLFQAFRELEESNKLNIRVGEQCLLTKKLIIQEFFNNGYKYGFGTDKFRVTSIKIISDGSLGARTAALRNNYADDNSTKGIAIFLQQELDEIVLLSHRNNCPVAIHAIGDRAIEMALNAIGKAQKTDSTHHPRHGIVHCQITDDTLLQRIKDLNVMVLIQPIFIDYDMNIVSDRVGSELAKTSYVWKTMIDKGIHASFGTDCPVESFDPMQNIYSAVTRKNFTGEEKKTYLPNEKMSMHEAIYAYTVESAYASGEENIKGSIAVEKLADFIVLDKDLFNLSNDEEILKTHIVKTYVNGKLVYSI